MRRLTVAVLFLIACPGSPALGAGIDANASITVDPWLPHLAHIHKGTCGRLAQMPVAELAEVAAPEEALEAQPVMVSQPHPEHFVYYTLDDLIAGGYAVAIHYPMEIIRENGLRLPETYVACGEIQGSRVADGSLAIALHQQNDSGYAGIALLAPNPEADSLTLQTLVTIYLIPPLVAAGMTGTPAASQ